MIREEPQATQEVSVTAEMLEAGDAVIRAQFYDLWESTTREEKAEFLRRVFAAMSENRCTDLR